MSLFFLLPSAGAATLTLANASVTHSTPSPPALAYIVLNTDGTVDKHEGVTVTQLNPTTDWIIPIEKALGASYEVKWDKISGTAPTLTTNFVTEATYYDLATARTIGYTVGTTSVQAGVIRISIRRTGTTTVVDTADFTLSATHT